MSPPIPVIAIVAVKAKMLSMFRWQSLPLGLPTPFQALRLFHLSWAQEEPIPIPIFHTPGDWYEMDPLALVSPSGVAHPWVSLAQEEWIFAWSSQVQVNQSLNPHSAKAVPLGLAWLLAVLRLWWATAWDLVLFREPARLSHRPEPIMLTGTR